MYTVHNYLFQIWNFLMASPLIELLWYALSERSRCIYVLLDSRMPRPALDYLAILGPLPYTPDFVLSRFYLARFCLLEILSVLRFCPCRDFVFVEILSLSRFCPCQDFVWPGFVWWGSVLVPLIHDICKNCIFHRLTFRKLTNLASKGSIDPGITSLYENFDCWPPSCKNLHNNF